MGKVVPIRKDMKVVHHMNATTGYMVETNLFRRYEQGLCQSCDNARVELSPWCATHFPWKDQVPVIPPAVVGKRGI